MKKHTCFSLLTLGALLFASFVFAAEFSPALESELMSKKDAEFVSAIVILESPIDIRALDDRLHIQKASRVERYREVIEALHYNADVTQPAIRSEFDKAIDEGRMKGYTAYWIENLFIISATKELVESLRPRDDIKYVTENFKAELIEPLRSNVKAGSDPRDEQGSLDSRTVPPGIAAMGAVRVVEELGITGNGVLVGNCDTGVDGTHPALASRWRGNHAPWYHCWMDNLGTNTTSPNDQHYHGTHVMGTITGMAISGTDSTWIGVAPQAEWIANNAINQGVGGDFDNDIILTFQWFANPDSNINTMDDVPDVVQNSWGVNTGLGYVQCFDFWNSVILNCEAAGVVVTWSAGNEGTSGLRSPAIYSINETQIFSVGALDATNYSAPYPIASFSSQGPTPCTPADPNTIKPEISAPGVDVWSAQPGGGYQYLSGTSMAGPHVAGVVALMREACPDCDPTTIKQAIITTAIRTGYVTPPATENNVFGNGMIDAYAAVLAVSNLGRVGGIVTDGTNPLAGVRVANQSGTQFTFTDAAGQYYLPLPEGTYSVEFSKFSYITASQSGIAVTEGDTTIVNQVLSLAPQGTVSGIVTDCFGFPANGATVAVLDVPVTPATTNSSGFYSITLPQGTYDMRASGAGCGVQTVNDVVIGTSTTQNFTLPSDPRYSCSAPDAGGYSACENGDLNGPTYSWFEISPNAGGAGTLSGVAGDDAGATLTLPFTFRFYGVDYTSVWVCSNGFLSFSTTSTAYSNAALPSATIGAAICPFWDDLNSSTGDISYYYHAAENAFIVEWHEVPHYSSGGPETFQVWLYNLATNPGPNGDSQIRIQYQTVASGGSNTIGVSNGSTIASQYVYNGALDVSSQGIANMHVITYGGSTTPEFGTMQGTITFCSGGAAANAAVSFPGSFYPAITADANGFYTLDMVPGTYSVRADKYPCSYTQSDGHVVTIGGTTTVNLTLSAPGTLEGTITSCNGGPAVGATVALTGTAIPSQTTNATGYYEFAELPAGTYEIDVTFAGCAPGSESGIEIASGMVTTQNLTLISDPAAECSPVDGYGYYACENLDPDGPAFSWIGAHPSEGGAGTILANACDDCYTGPIALPFNVQFYGAVYTDFYVGSNGYVTFGSGNTSYSNVCFPATSMAAGCYPFWDDLYTTCTTADVVGYYDETNHRYVVEFYNVCHCCSEGNTENFEIIFYDAAYYPTATGDNDIVFQYNSLSLVTSNTVGIQSAAGADYLLYQCNNVYQTHAFGIEQGRAIKFTTGPGCEGTPDISVNPTGVIGSAPLNGTDLESVEICNLGVCPLRYTVEFNQLTPAAALSSAVLPRVVEMTKEHVDWLEAVNRGEKLPPLYPNGVMTRDALDSQGGPDSFGYTWIDS
ncbi:MAG: carboxypeptidase regulatory-like domain-containing protein, partial [Calditrichota bacterium]